MKISFEKRLILFFTIIFLGIIILGIVASRNNRTTLETNKLIAHTKEVIAESELVLSLSKDIVIGSQRYVITGDSSFIGYFSTSKEIVFVHIRNLKDLTKDNPVQQVRVDSLDFLMKDRIIFSNLYMRVRNENGFDAASKMIATGRGKFYIDKIRDLINQIEGEENFLLIQRQQANNSSITAFNQAFYALLIGVFIFLGVVFLYVLYNSRKRARAEQQIIRLNSELKKNVEQMEAVNKELEAFSYSVSHDLRSPLRIIDGYANILIQDYKEKIDEEGNRTLGIIKSNPQRMGQLIDDLLNLSRLGRKELVLHKVNINEIVQSIIMEQMEHNPSAHVEIKVDQLEPANCDTNLIRQVWSNLISNAFKYSGRKEKAIVEIGSYKKENEVIYFVKDNGVGFDMKYVDKLFGVFQRLHKMTEFEGTGVGLAIVQRIILKHGGRVWAEAEPDKGATFYFSLPV